MSLKYFELLESAEPQTREQLIELFSQDYTFAKLCLILRDEVNTKNTYFSVLEMFEYFDVKVGYGENLFDKLQNLRVVVEDEKYVRGRKPQLTPDKDLLFLMTTLRCKNKHDRFHFMKDLFLNCDELDFKWVIKIICSPEQVRLLI